MSTKKDTCRLTAATELRRQIEEQLCAKTFKRHQPRSGEETLRLVHELEVHQIELEMQNRELRHARNDMETALENYTELYDFAPVGYVTLDRTGVISAVNHAGATLIGGVRSLMINRSFKMFVAAADRSAFTEFLGTILTCPVKGSCEVALVKKGNQTVIVQIEAMATASGHEFRLALIDITERRCTEVALAKQRQELKDHNSSLEVRINAAVDDIRQKDQLLILQDRRAIMGEMINNIAHQWRQPLNVLGLYLQELPVVYGSEDFNRTYLDTVVKKSMQVILHMSRTIDDFRNFFRSDKKKISFSINRVIGQTLTLIDASFKEQQIGIAFHPETIPMTSGYPNEYAQVLLNILMNARDALIGHNSGTALISIRMFAKGDTSVVTITDNAGGISEKIIDRIFDPYFTTKGPDKGTGIGLFMSKTIIEKNMGGRISARNTGSGAEFRIEV
ncbi:MAG: PAS domain-containing sensor histidine kinase [Proteobacteria bacterium]|nr:PAS domain-containing sensor histidine kinase [Pseudomonadota bacterium]